VPPGAFPAAPLFFGASMDFLMSNLDVIIWSVLAGIFLVMEMVTVATVSIWFVAGCVVAVAAALIGAPVWLEIILALGVSGGCFLGFRKMLVGKSPKALEEKVTDGIEGKIAVVTTKIEPGMRGQIKIDGIEWTAASLNEDETLPENTRVVICRQEGVCCYVEKYDIGA